MGLHREWSSVKLHRFFPGIPALLSELVTHRANLFGQHQKLNGRQRQSDIAAHQMNTAGLAAVAAAKWGSGGMLVRH
jgi:hypothetical protein